MVLLEVFICTDGTFISFATEMSQCVLDHVAMLNRKKCLYLFNSFHSIMEVRGRIC